MSFARPDKPHPSSSQKSLDPDDPDPISKVGGEGGYMHKKIVIYYNIIQHNILLYYIM